MGLPSGILGALAARSAPGTVSGPGVPGAPDSREAAAALARAIAALHSFLDLEKDPQDRAAVSTCLARLETIRGKKISPPGAGNQNSPSPGGGMGFPGAGSPY